MEKIKKKGIYNFQLHTGSGKSRIIETFINKHKKQTHLLLVPSIQILQQFTTYFQLPQLQYTEATKEEMQRQSFITIAVYNSIDKVIKNTYDYIYIDEAHHIFKPEVIRLLRQRSESEQNYIQKIQTKLKYKYQFNFSATFGRVNLSYQLTMNDALKEKIITDYRIHLVLFGRDDKEMNKFEGKKIIVYCRTIEDCIKLSYKLKCNYLSGDMNLQRRQEIINEFKSKHKFLCSCKTISEGVDLPFADGAVFFCLKRSEIDIIQCIGRTQRLYPGKALSHIYVLMKKKHNLYEVWRYFALYCAVIAEYDKKIKDKIDLIYDEEQDDVDEETVQRIKDNVFKRCRLCCHKVKLDDLVMLQLCEKFYKNKHRLPKIDEVIQDDNDQPFKIGRFINCVRNGRYIALQVYLLEIFEVTKL